MRKLVIQADLEPVSHRAAIGVIPLQRKEGALLRVINAALIAVYELIGARQVQLRRLLHDKIQPPLCRRPVGKHGIGVVFVITGKFLRTDITTAFKVIEITVVAAEPVTEAVDIAFAGQPGGFFLVGRAIDQVSLTVERRTLLETLALCA